MTREENIRAILECNFSGFKDEIIDVAVNAILNLKAEPCEDCVSRQSVLDLVVANHRELNGVNVVMYSPLYKDIKELPSVNPQTDVLDEIRAEIDAKFDDRPSNYNHAQRREFYSDVVAIIDKYRKEQSNADSNQHFRRTNGHG